jgi:signal transduction histidine kinase
MSSNSHDSYSDSDVLKAVHRIATGLFARPGLDEILPEALAAAMESVGARAGSIWLHDPREDTLVARHAEGGAGASLIGFKLPANRGVVGDVFQTGHLANVGDANRDTRHVDVATDFRTEAICTVPLKNRGGRPIGALQVMNKASGGLFKDKDVVILETLASLAATAIENAQQAERERKAAVADAVGDIAHDIKNMMTPVESWASLLELIAQDSLVALKRVEEAAPPELQDDLKAARELFDILPEGLEGIRDGAHQVKDRGAEIADALKGNVRAPSFVVEDIIKTINRVVQTLRPSAESRGINISMEGECRPFPHDRAHLFNALYNLVNNAIPFVPSGGSIRVILGEGNGFAEIAVVDTGAGMTEEIRASLFTEHARTTKEDGTGLGTGIVYRVAIAHRGTVTVESELGKGSTFRLRLPLTRDGA